MNNSWFKSLCIYQIWPRSFKDGNGDGIGDLKGIYEKLDYIKSLGANAIWFSPLYVSPQKDYGYDIADYKQIDPSYGTLDDFKKVLKGAHDRDMKVIMDLVVNHTSDQHEWFKKSVRREGKYEDFYIWRKGKGKDGKRPPNNWDATFPGSAWEYNETRGEYYLHLYAKEQPDLNHDNPEVREAVKDVMRFWLDMGVDGFREDVITQISKTEGLPNGFPLPAFTGMQYYNGGPHIHEYLSEYRKVLEEYNCFVVGEAPTMTPKKALTYVAGPNGVELDMMIGFEHMTADCFQISWLKHKFNLRKLKRVYNNWQTMLFEKGWNANYIENHDQPRVISRYGDTVQYWAKSGKALATMYALLSGCMFVYQGQEIGMTNTTYETWNDFKDVSTFCTKDLCEKLLLPKKFIFKRATYAARDNARTPVQWDNSLYAGFSEAEPWFKVNDNYKEINVATQEKDPDSILNYYRAIIALRNKYKEEAIYGKFDLKMKYNSDVMIYDKVSDKGILTVVINLSKNAIFTKRIKKYIPKNAKQILSNVDYPLGKTMNPYDAYVYYSKK